MKKLFCLLIAAALLFGIASSALAENAEADDSAAIQEQLEKLWDFARLILNGREETAAEKQIKAWKAEGKMVYEPDDLENVSENTFEVIYSANFAKVAFEDFANYVDNDYVKDNFGDEIYAMQLVGFFFD